METPIIIISAKDIKAFLVTSPIAKRALQSKWQVKIVTEGPAGQRFVDAGFTPDFLGPTDTRKIPFTFNAYQYLKNSFTEDGPAILVIGESNPSHLERKLGIAAMKLNKTRKRKIVVVEIQDLWGGAIRLSGVKPHHILTLDTYAKKLALKTHRYLSQNDVTIVGNPSVQKITVSRKVRHTHNRLKKRFDCLYYYAGGGVSTGAELKLLMNCLTRTSGNWGLIVGFHPNYIKTFGETWRKMLLPFQKNDKVFEAEAGTGDEWAKLTATISGFSGALVIAACAHQPVISLWTTETRRCLKTASGLKEIPLVTLRCAHRVDTPTDLSKFRPAGLKHLSKLKPYNPDLAWQTIRMLI